MDLVKAEPKVRCGARDAHLDNHFDKVDEAKGAAGGELRSLKSLWLIVMNRKHHGAVSDEDKLHKWPPPRPPDERRARSVELSADERGRSRRREALLGGGTRQDGPHSARLCCFGAEKRLRLHRLVLTEGVDDRTDKDVHETKV